MGSSTPYRLELIDDEIEAIKIFDPDTQRTLYPAEEIRILPSREFPIGKSSADRFRINWRKNFAGDPLKCTLYRDVGKEIFGSGIEYYLPFLHEKLDTIFSYLKNDGKICIADMTSLHPYTNPVQILYTMGGTYPPYRGW